MNTGQRIKELREIRNINQKTLAQKIGISNASLSAIEKGKSNPSYETLIEISDFFKVSTDYLLTGKAEIASINDDEIELLKILREDNALKNAVMDAASFKKKAINYLVSYQQQHAHAA